MINIQKLSKRPKIFKTLCGLTPGQFDKLLNEITPLWEEAEYKRQDWKGRKRPIGGGRPKKLSLGQALFMLLLYYRTYTNHIFIGMVSGIDDSNVGRYIKRLGPILSKLFKIPTKKIKLNEDEIWDLIVDATEQESQKRKGSGYSGKKKKQTIKTQITINERGIIKAVSKSIRGNRHDKKLYDQTRSYTYNNRDGTATKSVQNIRIKTLADLGYCGTECEIPKKKPQNRPLMMHEDYYNKKHAQRRIKVEHTLAHLKKWHILADKFRNKVNGYNLIFRNIAGIRNFIMVTA